MANLVKLELSKKQISFQPDHFKDFSRSDDQPAEGDFQVTVVNLSDRFSSFQIELEVGEQRQRGNERWYRVEPDICAKKPPGDRTVFNVTLLRSPVHSYDITIPITVRVLSIEVAQLTAEDTLFLKVQRPRKTLHAYLPVEDLTVYPGDRCHIPVLVYNLNPIAQPVTLRLKGIDPNWLPDGHEQIMHLDAGESREAGFWCAPPALAKTQHQTYSILLEVFDDKGNTASARSNFEVLPFGQVVFDCAEPVQQIPPGRLGRQRRRRTAQYDLTLNNQSNVAVAIKFTSSEAANHGQSIQVELPSTIDLVSDAIANSPLQVAAKRPWLGLRRTEVIDVTPTLQWPGSGEPVQQIAVNPASERLELKLLPRIPVWLQMGGAVLALALLLLGGWLLPRRYHTAPVTAITLMSNGDTLISGSSDQTLRRWQVNPDSWLPDIRRLRANGFLASELGQSVRTIRHLPAEVRQLAVGLENGAVQIWDIAARAQIGEVFHEEGRPDRVFALDFTEDSRYLFSGHGSGQVRLWGRTVDSDSPLQRLYPPGEFSFAIAALTSMEPRGREPVVAIGGRHNRLVLWQWESRLAFNIDYSAGLVATNATAFTPVVSRQSFLTSLAGADDAIVMASADNQGFITLWSMDALHTCMERQAETFQVFGRPAQSMDVDRNVYVDISITNECRSAILDQWQASPGGQAIRAVALTENGCYLSSVGDDGRVVLWPLDATYRRDRQHANGWQLQQYRRNKLNTVDIHRDTAAEDDVILVAHDVPGNRVQLHRRQVRRNDCQ